MTRLIVDDTAAVPPTAQMALKQGRVEVLVDVDLYPHELRRREHRTAKPILSLDLLNLLLTMPLISVTPGKQPWRPAGTMSQNSEGNAGPRPRGGGRWLIA